MNKTFYLSKFLVILSLLLFSNDISCQIEEYSEKDILRGSLRPERTSFDVKHYDLHVAFNITDKSITGNNHIDIDMLETSDEIQLDLFENMDIDSIILRGNHLNYRRQCDAVFIDARSLQKNKSYTISVFYHGKPVIAKMAPWDGGFIWSIDPAGKTWLAVACEGLGASSWWPNKDHLSDEPDSMSMHFTIPSDLSCISNGNLIDIIELENGLSQHNWKVSYPINSYNVTFNIGVYEHFSDIYTSADGAFLDMDYYVQPQNLQKAKAHFMQAHTVLEAFEHLFGKYPYWNDGYALVETPYLGMEHQSAIAYGNKYMRGYMGGMIPPEMNFDYIILHETAHEYFGNSISCNDHAEMWIHESFATYAEALFVEYHMGGLAADRYLSFQKKHSNVKPIIGPKGVNYQSWNASDHYFKGSWVLHTLRNVINDDEVWFNLLKEMYQHFQHSNIDSEDIFKFINAYTKSNFDLFFKQYLYSPDIPTLKYKLTQHDHSLEVEAIWENVVDGFSMPIKLGSSSNWTFVTIGSQQWTTIQIDDLSTDDFEIAEDKFLIRYRQ